MKLKPASRSDEILLRLSALHPKKIDLSLERVVRLLDKLGRPQNDGPPVIHVGGTNGKGSTIAFMRAMLEAAGKSVHVYTSPHLVRFHERIRLGAVGGGHFVDEDDLAATLADCERVNAGEPITFFEMTTAAAFVLFRQRPADILLLEVGLGGRFDATNVVTPIASVVTPVSMDHIEFLGSTIEAIAFEKAGIFKRGVPAVIGHQGPAAAAVLDREARRVGAIPLVAAQDFLFREEQGRFVFEDGDGLLDLPLPRLAGSHQHQNAAAAIATLRRCFPDLDPKAIETGMVRAEWPARLQRLTRGDLVALVPPGAELWLDGGHNEDGGKVVGQAMADLEDRCSRPLIVICGTLATKDTAGFLRPFKGLAQELLAVPVSGEQAGRPPRDVVACGLSVGSAERRLSERPASLVVPARQTLDGAAAHSDRRQPLPRRQRARGERHATKVERRPMSRTRSDKGKHCKQPVPQRQIASEIQRLSSPLGAAPTFCEVTLPSL